MGKHTERSKWVVFLCVCVWYTGTVFFDLINFNEIHFYLNTRVCFVSEIAGRLCANTDIRKLFKS